MPAHAATADGSQARRRRLGQPTVGLRPPSDRPNRPSARVAHRPSVVSRCTFAAVDQARAIPLGDVAFGPVCAPGYPARHLAGTFQAPARIAHDYTGRAWSGWESASGIAFSCEKELSFPHTHLCIEAAIAGLGVAVAEQRLVADDLFAGRLTAPCGFTAFAQGWAAMPFSSRAQAPAGRAFVAWLHVTLS